MYFSTRNAFYLRVSNYRVVPLFLYLDERHVDWMTDHFLQLVIAALQPKMEGLLTEARGSKKHKVHVERGDGYQYCYFLRSTTRTEVVLLKQKQFSLRPPTPPREETPLVQAPKRSRTSSVRPSATPKKPARRERSARGRSTSVAESMGRGEEEGSPPLVPIDGRAETPLFMAGSEAGEEYEEEDVKPDIDVSADEDEDMEVNIKDWKPDISVTFKGFGTSSLQLVLIVEPYPPLPADQYAPPSSRLSSRSASIVSSRSRTRQAATFSRAGGTGSRFSSMSQSVGPLAQLQRQQAPNPTNMRNASSTPGPSHSYGRGGRGTPSGSTTPFGGDPREASTFDGEDGPRGRSKSATPLFLPRDTPFGEDEEDEEAHEAYLEALSEGRTRLPSVSRPAGSEDPEEQDASGKGKRKRGSGSRSRSRVVELDEEEGDDIPETLAVMSQRLVRSSEIGEGVNFVKSGWDGGEDGEESADPDRQEPGE